LVSQKPNTAIAFSGGGSRAYVAAIGYLAGLNKLDLIKNIRYIGGKYFTDKYFFFSI
jgi:predicted acylesterase/phospholipase RssA